MVTPDEAAADHPNVNGHELRPKESKHPINDDPVWKCVDCDRRATDMEVFETFICGDS